MDGRASVNGAADLSAARADFSRIGLGAFVILVVTYGIQFLLVLLLQLSSANLREDPVMILILSYVPMYCIAVPAGYFLMRRVPRSPLPQGELGRGNFFRIIPICFFLMYGGNLLGSIVNSAISDSLGVPVSNPVEDLIAGSIPLPALFVLTVILAPIFEELIFRKLMIDRMNIYGQGTAIVTSALMFGLFHGNFSQFFYAAALGLVFGYVYTKTGRVRYSIGLHMVVNFWGGIVSGALVTDESVQALMDGDLDIADISELSEMITPAVVLFAVYALVTLVLAVAGLVMFFRYRRNISLAPAELQLPAGSGFKTVWLNAGMILFVIASAAVMAVSIYGV